MTAYTRPFLYPKQEQALFCPERISTVEASAQPLDTDIPTPFGWTKFGQLKVGDFVFSIDGSPTQITNIFPLGKRPVYRLTFTGNVTTRACGEHLWKVDHSAGRGERIVTTNELINFAENTRSMWNFPVCDPVEYPFRKVPLDPWLVGVLIGDGYICGNIISFSSADDEIIQRVKSAVPIGYEVREVKGTEYSYIITPRVRGAGYEKPNIRSRAGGFEVSVGKKYVGRRWTYEEALALHKTAMQEHYGEDLPEINIRQALRELGLLGLKHNEKFIPRVYMENSPDIRLEILRGIMDTDDSASMGNSAVLEQTSYRLAKDMEELVRSLGGFIKTTRTPGRTANCKDSYRQNIRARDMREFFWLGRKRDRVEPVPGFARKLLTIELLEEEEVQCIAVDHPSSLYLTDDFIVTHNTKSGKTCGCIAWIVEEALHGRDNHNFWWVAPGYSQAEIAYKRIKNGLTRGSFVAFDSPTPKIKLVNGAWIWFKSADDPDKLYGEDVYAAVVDEASRTSADSYHAIYSTLTATRGKLRAIGNVKGRKNWFYDLCRRAEAEMRSPANGKFPALRYSKITADDAVSAGVIQQDIIEDARRDLPENVFRELYYAEPGDDTGNPFGLDHIRACVCDGLAPGPVVAWGIDLAKKQDYFVMVGLNASGGVADFHRWRGVPWPQSIARVRKIVGEDTAALVDSTGVGDPVLDELQIERANFLGYYFTATSKQKLMEGLAVSIQGHELTFPDTPAVPIRFELDLFEYELTARGVKYSAPAGHNDDCVAALALARQMWSETAPGANITAFYAAQSARAGAIVAANEDRDDNRPWRDGNPLVIHASDVLDNELEDLYNETVAKSLPSLRRDCVVCGLAVTGASRVSDGVSFWHNACAGRGARVRAAA